LAPGAGRLGFNSLVIAAILRQAQRLSAFAFAVFAAFGFVLELFIVKKELFASGEDKIGAAVYTLENLVLELH
jgi:succinate dehydrogenase/fumarate reductase cytochrome b subunit